MRLFFNYLISLFLCFDHFSLISGAFRISSAMSKRKGLSDDNSNSGIVEFLMGMLLYSTVSSLKIMYVTRQDKMSP